VRNRERARRTHERTVPLDIVTYNVHLLPDIAARIAGERNQSAYRAGAIAERLAHYDIVGICEAFDPNYSRTLLDGLQAQSAQAFHIAQGPQRSGRAFTHSGLVLLSRYEIEATHTITYRNASRFVTHGFRADGFAAKGALHCRLRLSDEPQSKVDCFLTHMESRSAKARRLQVEQFAAFVAEHSSPERPVVVLGDFNVAADSNDGAIQLNGNSPYRQLRNKLVHNGRRLLDVWSQLEATHVGTSDALAQDGGRRIDYIFVSAPRAGDANRLVPRDVMALPFADDHVREGSLSDHAALACQADFRAAEPARR
jgi:endonuclease/exonuclease/phosphatase family metal-dependent hydrolase